MKKPHTYLPAALALTASGAMADPVVCEQGALTRTIEVVYVNPGQALPCEVIYDKSSEGSLETLWRASNEAGYCEAKAAALADQLSEFGWRCAAVSASAETQMEAPEERLGDIDESS